MKNKNTQKEPINGFAITGTNTIAPGAGQRAYINWYPFDDKLGGYSGDEVFAGLRKCILHLDAYSREVYFTVAICYVELPADSDPADGVVDPTKTIQEALQGLDASTEAIRYKILGIATSQVKAAYYSTSNVFVYHLHKRIDITKYLKTTWKKIHDETINNLESASGIDDRNFGLAFIWYLNTNEKTLYADFSTEFRFVNRTSLIGGL